VIDRYWLTEMLSPFINIAIAIVCIVVIGLFTTAVIGLLIVLIKSLTV
jgi:hypothetical protein